MKYRFEHLGIAIVSIYFVSISFAKESKRNTEEGGPPFYMMSFFEFHEATAVQQKTYIELLKKAPVLQDANGSWRIHDFIKAAQDNEDSWQSLMDKVNSACLVKVNSQNCKRLEEIRLKTFFLQSRKTTEDRKSEEK